jgi:hypothetical protein
MRASTVPTRGRVAIGALEADELLGDELAQSAWRFRIGDEPDDLLLFAAAGVSFWRGRTANKFRQLIRMTYFK